MNLETLIKALPDNFISADIELIKRAYSVAESAHEGQKRASGEPYINHCVAVASILVELCVPPAVVAAGLLHDTVEDTDITLKDIERDFGSEICSLVDGVTKLTQLPRVTRGDQHHVESSDQVQLSSSNDRRYDLDSDYEIEQIQRRRHYDLVSETLRKTFLAMGEDVRVVLIKLADRLHNMRTLNYMPEKKRRRIAQETLDIFAPLASRLGIWQIKWDLEDLAFRYVNHEVYHDIADRLNERLSSREKQIQEIRRKLEHVLTQAGIDAEITVRTKRIYSIFKKVYG
jgi:GTP pyrophosphokinase